jgi:hypothetical protein
MSIIVIMGWMMMLKTLLDVKLALLHSEVDRANLLLHRTHSPLNRLQGSHNLSKSCIILWRLRSNLRRGSSSRYLKLNWWRSFILTFMPQLGI